MDPTMQVFNWMQLDPNLFTPCGTMQAGGFSYQWLRNTLCHEERKEAEHKGISPYTVMDAAVSQTKPGAGGVLFLPYLLGERSPRWNPFATGCFLGLKGTTTKQDMMRAVMEGVAYNLKVVLDVLEGCGPISEIVMIGGGANGEIWNHIFADIWQKRLAVPANLREATSMGAAVCGGIGIGAFKDYRAAYQFNPVKRYLEPNGEHKAAYEKMYEMFNQAYTQLEPIYQGLAEE